MNSDRDRLAELERRLERLETVLIEALGISPGLLLESGPESSDVAAGGRAASPGAAGVAGEAYADADGRADADGGADAGEGAASEDSERSSRRLAAARRSLRDDVNEAVSAGRAGERPASMRPARETPSRTAPGRDREPRLSDVFSGRDVTATTVMAAGAALSFILAAVYFLNLVRAAGWLTPPVQLGLALAAGGGFIAAGFLLRGTDRAYAAWLPAVGVIIFYLTVYAGHLYYRLYGPIPAAAAVAVVSVGALMLGRYFENSVYGALAAFGVYLTPLLIRAVAPDLTGLLVYFTAWSLLFSFLALNEGSRVTYLVALYMAVICFDGAWRLAGKPDWEIAAIYQFVQLVVFAATAAYFSVRLEQPMKPDEAVAHGLPLFYFYLVEWLILREHARGLVPIVGLASVVVVVGGYLLVRRRLPQAAGAAGLGLVSTYVCGATAHILFFELIPAAYVPWAALVLPITLVFVMQLREDGLPQPVLVPAVVATAVLLAYSAVLLLGGAALKVDVPFPAGVLFAYAAALYATYAFLAKREEHQQFLPVLLYAGHLAFMVATVRAFDSGLLISTVWAVFAVALLGLALKLEDRTIGQSSLLVFSASAVKVLLFDLAGSPSLVRIVTLIVVGISLYAGGWLYQNLSERARRYHPNPVINRHLKLIHTLARQGYDDAAIADRLTEAGVACLASGGWSAALIADIRRKFRLD